MLACMLAGDDDVDDEKKVNSLSDISVNQYDDEIIESSVFLLFVIIATSYSLR